MYVIVFSVHCNPENERCGMYTLNTSSLVLHREEQTHLLCMTHYFITKSYIEKDIWYIERYIFGIKNKTYQIHSANS